MMTGVEMQEKLLRRGLGELNQANREFLRGNLRLTHNHASLASDCLSDQRLEMQERKVEAALIQGRSARMMANLEVAENALRRARRLSWRGIDPVDCLHPAIELELLQLEEARGQFTQACHDYQALKRKLRPWPDLRLVAETRALACAVKTSDFDSAKRLNSGLELVLPGFNIREECGARRWQAIYGIRRGDFPFAEERLEDAGRVADNLGAPLEIPLNGLAIAHLYLKRGTPGDRELGREQFLHAMQGAKDRDLWSAMATASNAMEDLLD